MLEAFLQAQLKKIFDLKKATFNHPGDSQEQECLFIQVDSAKSSIKEKNQVSKVTGKLRVFANSEKLPLGYFSKKIEEADAADTKNFFFFDFEENAGTFQNITERTLGFVFFFTAQYNPNLGLINELNSEIQVN